MRKKVRGFLAGKEHLASLHILQQTTLLKGLMELLSLPSLPAYASSISGASSGIGVETARVLALRGVHVVMAVRNLDAGRNVKEAILNEINGAKIDVMQLDLSSMPNNAGVMATPFMLSHENIELQFATNHLGHFLLTNLLLDTMKLTARESKRERKIVNLSSKGHRMVYGEGNPFDHINDESGYCPRFAYGQSKLANIFMLMSFQGV
ncbi:short-chain dehydrogenase TIC 32, chloroplastic-like [Gossypium arboreum]|uniref:short-chain dehydrogenase TIC 32, chloroplastic-like n=1 Tax=Gossypium arboreum TaxID=29729 RepID=UPI0008195195|nr:short-chain dehydrogenase TIC 32, chloroplastic-like [Gossypium arboreum]